MLFGGKNDIRHMYKYQILYGDIICRYYIEMLYRDRDFNNNHNFFSHFYEFRTNICTV